MTTEAKEKTPEELQRMEEHHRMMEAKMAEMETITEEERRAREAKMEKKHAAVDATTLMAARRAMRDLDSTPHRDAIAELHRRGIVGGYADGTYRPAAGVNRAEMLKMIMESKYTVDPSYAQKSCFSDVPAGEWYTAAICYAAAKGIVQGYPDGTFRPEERVRYAEALKITLATYGVGPEEVKDEVNAPWYRGYERRARAMNMDLPVAPDHGMDRGQMAEVLHRLLQAKGY